jgi:hypothetical protein
VSGRAAKPGMTEREHHAWGALLKYVEAIAIAYRYDRYPKSSKTGKKIDRLIKAIYELRDQLNHEYGWVATEHLIPKDPHDHQGRQDWWQARIAALRNDVYNGKESQELRDFVIFRLEMGPGLYHEEVQELFMRQVKKSVAAAQGQVLKLPWGAPPVLPIPASLPKADKHADLRAALLQNPDQPQAAFVARFHVHPNTVRRCRRELEEAGAIPFLSHRHATPEQTTVVPAATLSQSARGSA